MRAAIGIVIVGLPVIAGLIYYGFNPSRSVSPDRAALERAKAGPYIASTKQISDSETLSTVIVPSTIGTMLDKHCFIYTNREYRQVRFTCPEGAPLDVGSIEQN